MNESQIIAAIKAHIAKGDKAAEKSEQHYIAAGQHLHTLKAEHGGTWAEWEKLLKTKVGIGKSRASELRDPDSRRLPPPPAPQRPPGGMHRTQFAILQKEKSE